MALSVYKPRGTTRYGWRKLRAQLAAGAAVEAANYQNNATISSRREACASIHAPVARHTAGCIDRG